VWLEIKLNEVHKQEEQKRNRGNH